MRGVWLVVACGLSVAGCVTDDTKVGDMGGMLIWHPPAQYDHRYQGRMVERRKTWQDARTMCSTIVSEPVSLSGSPSRPDACQWFVGKTCYIVIPTGADVTPLETIAYRHHEIAHCNGWPESHPGGY